MRVAITGSGLYTPAESISNDELVACYNAWATPIEEASTLPA